MSSTTRIVAQLAPQRSTQYSNLARDLAEAELLASPIGSRLQDVSLRNIAGQDYVQFSLPDPITNETARLLASRRMLGGVFRDLRLHRRRHGPLLRRAAVPPAFISPTWPRPWLQARPTKPFTHLFLQLASTRRFAQRVGGARSSIRVRGGTTLFRLCRWAPIRRPRMLTYRRQLAATFITRIAGRTHRSRTRRRLRKLGARRWLFQIGRDDVRRCMLALGDAGRTGELLAGFGRPHLIVTDLPYGIQHSGPLHGLLADCLPGWAELLVSGGAIAFSWDSTGSVGMR